MATRLSLAQFRHLYRAVVVRDVTVLLLSTVDIYHSVEMGSSPRPNFSLRLPREFRKAHVVLTL